MTGGRDPTQAPGRRGGGGGKPIIGLCGGIGSGKSQVAAELGKLGAMVISSDELNHEVLRRPEVLARLREWWGESVVAPDGQPNRRRIAEIIFEYPAEKSRLQALVYPLIEQVREAMIQRGLEDPAVKAIILDTPLLFESNLDQRCDKIIFVEAPEEQRLERVRRERGWSAEEFRRRQRWQLPLEFKRSRSDFVVVNEGSIEQLARQVRKVFEQVVNPHTPQD